MRCQETKLRTAGGGTLDDRIHLVFTRDATGQWQRTRLRDLARGEPREVLVVPRTAVAEMGRHGLEHPERYGGFRTTVDPTHASARDAVPFDPAALYGSGQYGELAAGLRAAAGSDLAASLAAYPDAAAALVAVATPAELEALARVGERGPLLAAVVAVADRAQADALVRGADPEQLGALLAHRRAGPGSAYLLNHADVHPHRDWGDTTLGWALGNPNLDVHQAARARQYWSSQRVHLDEARALPGFQLDADRTALLVANARHVGRGLASPVHPPDAVAAAVGTLHEAGAVALVEHRALEGPVVEAALANGYPAVRRALTRRCLTELGAPREPGEPDTSPLAAATLARLAGDHDLAVRCLLAEHSADPAVLATLARSPERLVQDRLVARGVAVEKPDAVPVDRDAPPPWPEDAGVDVWRALADRPAFGEPVDDRWESRAVATRMRLEADAAVLAQARELARVTDGAPRRALREVDQAHRGPGWEAAVAATRADVLHGITHQAMHRGVEDGELADAAAALAMTWQETGNTRTGSPGNQWLAELAAEEFGVPGRYDRGVPAEEAARRRPVVDELHARAGALGRAFLRGAHEEAQDRFRAAGVTHVAVTRGMSLSRAEAEELGLTVFDDADFATGRAAFTPSAAGIPQSTISSWGYGATGCSWAGPATDEVRVVVRAMVPVEDVLGFCPAGFNGHVLADGGLFWSEGEVMLLDRDRPCEILASTSRQHAAHARTLLGDPPG